MASQPKERRPGSRGTDDCTLVEALDRLLTTGVVVNGDLVVSVAGVELLYAGLNLVLASVDTMERFGAEMPGLRQGLESPWPSARDLAADERPLDPAKETA